MASRGWEGVTPTDLARIRDRFAPAAKVSKYRNQRVEVDGQMFDSKREAAAWMRLRAREQAGEIRNLRRQVPFDLMCPCKDGEAMYAVVARYVSDFTYLDADDQMHVVDAKGVRTQIYALKRKWLELQTGIAIEEI